MPELPSLAWTPAADAVGYVEVAFKELERHRRPAGRRTTLANPAQAWLDRLRAVPAIAVRGVELHTLDDLKALHGYVLEPAWRAGTKLLVESEQRLTQLDPRRFVDPLFEYPYTLERALHAATRMWHGHAVPAPSQERSATLDPEQRRAVATHDGTVQIIAPAGSGKTTVLIERARELRRRGVPAQRILATTFNSAARRELAQRLAAAGERAVEARTFHSLGLAILREERLVRSERVTQLSLNQWKRLCALASRDTGTWVDPGRARAAVSEIKLGLLATPGEYAPESHPDGETIARVYALYERHLAEQHAHDFDDMVMLAVRALRADGALRARWQERFSHVLVDEYQDIEPAQELLVRILAAPEDGLFCVGDEDQTLYGWRRASVRRMVDLDLAYPGLERVALTYNYRCPPAIVTASRALIARNEIRFPKEIRPAREPGGVAIELREPGSQAEGAARIAADLRGAARGGAVVLARTTNLLRAVALACAARGVAISAPEAIFEARGALEAVEAYLRLCADPASARADDVATVCRAPSRGLPFEAESRVAALLRDGFSFTESFAGLVAVDWQRARLDTAGRVLDALAGMRDAARFVTYLRQAGGLDQHFSEHEEAFGDTEKVELEILEQAQQEAGGMTVAEYSALLAERADALRAARDGEHGIELATIHGAKGRQWPLVHLFACEEGQLPHRRALQVADDARAAGEGEEAERRLAYVAFTRAQERLVITATATAPSRFLTEAGLSPREPWTPPAAPASPSSKPRHEDPRIAHGLGEAERVGLRYAIRTAEDRAVALEVAATALERRMVGVTTTSDKMTVDNLLAALEQLSDAERGEAITASGVRGGQVLVGRLDTGRRRSLARALRALA